MHAPTERVGGLHKKSQVRGCLGLFVPSERLLVQG